MIGYEVFGEFSLRNFSGIRLTRTVCYYWNCRPEGSGLRGLVSFGLIFHLRAAITVNFSFRRVDYQGLYVDARLRRCEAKSHLEVTCVMITIG